ncbi:hypothetical protein Acr_02g0013360 [Actinidia rufa]|uniref:Small ribosomal subunit protein mS38 n=1 Tax=Actinidia rufa TaxID=165716 RepID=A0A7J0EA89_9ERIC|nr:hypothetical protein Acr_02g0013360 [Actinidia rufa]
MASLLQKLLRKQSPNCIVASLSKQPPPNLIPSLLTHLHQNHIAESEPHHQCIANIVPFKTGNSISPRSIPTFPSFPFGFSLNPIGSTGFAPADAVSGDDRTIWADSVKKKRKKKMNKHKYRKLRKRLRRKT